MIKRIFTLSAAAVLAALCAAEESAFNAQKAAETIFIYLDGNRLEMTLADNPSARALAEILQDGDLSFAADDYGGFEKVGAIGRTLPRSDELIQTVPGDVILYQGSSICLYYGKNSWTFTRLGRIHGHSDSELRQLFRAGQGTVNIRISLH